MSDEENLRGLPTWLTWRAIYPGKSEREIDHMTRQSMKQTPESKIKTRQISTCQVGDDNVGVAEAYKKQLGPNWRTYKRVALFSPTTKGHQAAKKYASEIKYETYTGEMGENAMVTEWAENRSVKVLKVYCRDTDPKGNYWTVWVGFRSRESYFGTDEIPRGTEGTQHMTYQYRSGLRRPGQRSYHSGETGKFKTVQCPKCEAPVGESCRTETYPAGKVTNPHSARRKKYFEEQSEKKEEAEDE